MRGMRGRPGRTIGALVLAAASQAGCSGEPPPPSAVLITIDTTRADALDCDGWPELTPNLCSLAAESVHYRWARSVAPITLPAHASIMTGLYPPRHSVRVNALGALPPSATTLAERARAAGYETAAFVSAVVLDRSFGLDQGFDTYQGPAAAGARREERTAAEVTRAAVQWLEDRDPRKPFFLWVHYFDPHLPYVPEPAYFMRARGNRYLGEVAQMDASIGDLVAALRAADVYDDACIVVVADHGEGLGEHDEPTHAVFCYDTTLRVPLLVRPPGGPGRTGGTAGPALGGSSDTVVSVVDVFPTILDALGLEPEEGIDGVDLLADTPRPPGVYFESYYGHVYFGWSPLAGWAERARKYVHSSAPELYDALDGSELENLFEPRSEAVQRARAAIGAVAERPTLAPEAGTIDEELIDRIGSLGYATATGSSGALPHPLEPGDQPSPAQRHDEMTRVQRAMGLFGAGRHAQVIEILEPVVAASPGNRMALEYLCFSWIAAGRFQEAVEGLRHVLEMGLERAQTHSNLALALAALGEDEEARVHWEKALALDPRDVRAAYGLARLYAKQGDAEGAAAWRERARGLAGGD